MKEILQGITNRLDKLADKIKYLEKIQLPLYTTNISSGTSFPMAFPNNTPFYRTDLGFWCYYDGTRWLTTHEYVSTVGLSDSIANSYSTTANNVRLVTIRNDYILYLTRIHAFISVGATNNGANFFTYTVRDNSGLALWTFNTSADSAGNNVKSATAGGAITQPAAARTFINVDMTVTGTPSAQFPRVFSVYYRLIIP